MATEPGTDAHEVERLRAEVARLRAELGRGDPPTAAPAVSRAPRRWARSAAVVVCLALLALTAPLAVVATWAHDEVSDTDRYVETVAPLADDTAVQAAVTDRVTDVLVTRLDVAGVTQEALDALAARGVAPVVGSSLRALGPPLAQGIESFVHDQVSRLVASDAFADAWRQANREAHAQLVALVTGETDGAITTDGTAVRLNVAVILDAVKEQLVRAGFTLAERVPTVRAEFTLVESADVGRLQTGFRMLSGLARVLPVAALALLLGAVAASVRRRRTLVVGSVVVAASMLVLGLLLDVARVVYLDAVPAEALPPDAAAAVFDRLVEFVRLNLRAVLVLFLAVAAVAWVSGPGPGPTTVRRASRTSLDVVRHGLDRTGVDTGPVGAALARLRVPIRVTVAGLVAVVYVLADHPTGAWTAGLLGSAALVLLLVELLARDVPPEVSPVAAGPTSAGTTGPR